MESSVFKPLSLFNSVFHTANPPPPPAAYPYNHRPQGAYPRPPPHGYGGYPPPPAQGYGYTGHPPHGGYGYMPGQQPAKKHGNRAELGVGLAGGLLGGLLIGNMVSDASYDAGYVEGLDGRFDI
ncbi:hypothetical protein SLA2020_239460 [Shorea laevis]